MAVDQFFGERHTFELQELRVPVQAPVQGKTHFPGTRENSGVLNGGFVLDEVGTGRRIALGYMQRIAMKISGAVEPCFVVKVGYNDDQSVPIPMPDGPAHVAG